MPLENNLLLYKTVLKPIRTYAFNDREQQVTQTKILQCFQDALLMIPVRAKSRHTEGPERCV